MSTLPMKELVYLCESITKPLGIPDIVHQYQRDLLEMLEQHTPDTLYIQQPRSCGKQALQHWKEKHAMQLNIMKGLKAKVKKLRKPTVQEIRTKRYPAMKLHPHVIPRHADFWTNKRLYRGSNKYGKGRVLFTMKEGGLWQKWPWNWVPKAEAMADARAYAVAHDRQTVGWINPNPKRSTYSLRCHSMLIDGRRWDCINGFTS